MANARNFWRYFTKLVRFNGHNGALQAAAQLEKNMNKAKRIVKREIARRGRREQRMAAAEAVMNLNGPGLLTEEPSQTSNFEKVYRELDDKNCITLPDGDCVSTEPCMHTAHFCTPDESQQPGVIHGPNLVWANGTGIRFRAFLETFTRDQLRKAFSAAGITGFRNARKDQFLRHAMSTNERKAVYNALQFFQDRQ